MKQDKMAGVGNLWWDETLFQAGLHPERRANELSEDCLADLRTTMRRVLHQGVKVEADYKELPHDYLIRHREKGAECRRCGGEITSAKVGGRTAYFCSSHQK